MHHGSSADETEADETEADETKENASEDSDIKRDDAAPVREDPMRDPLGESEKTGLNVLHVGQDGAITIGPEPEHVAKLYRNTWRSSTRPRVQPGRPMSVRFGEECTTWKKG